MHYTAIHSSTGFPREQLRKLLLGIEYKRYRTGEALITEGDRVKQVLIVFEGHTLASVKLDLREGKGGGLSSQPFLAVAQGAQVLTRLQDLIQATPCMPCTIDQVLTRLQDLIQATGTCLALTLTLTLIQATGKCLGQLQELDTMPDIGIDPIHLGGDKDIEIDPIHLGGDNETIANDRDDKQKDGEKKEDENDDGNIGQGRQCSH